MDIALQSKIENPKSKIRPTFVVVTPHWKPNAPPPSTSSSTSSKKTCAPEPPSTASSSSRSPTSSGTSEESPTPRNNSSPNSPRKPARHLRINSPPPNPILSPDSIATSAPSNPPS